MSYVVLGFAWIGGECPVCREHRVAYNRKTERAVYISCGFAKPKLGNPFEPLKEAFGYMQERYG